MPKPLSRGYYPKQYEFEALVKRARQGEFTPEWKIEQQEAGERFRIAVERLYKMVGHPKANRMWSIVQDFSTVKGHEEVLYFYDELYLLIQRSNMHVIEGNSNETGRAIGDSSPDEVEKRTDNNRSSGDRLDDPN